MALPTPQYALAVGENIVVGSKTDDDKRYTIEQCVPFAAGTPSPLSGFHTSLTLSPHSRRLDSMDTNAYSCTCMAWRVVSKKTAVDVRTCKHIRDLLGDE